MKANGGDDLKTTSLKTRRTAIIKIIADIIAIVVGVLTILTLTGGFKHSKVRVTNKNAIELSRVENKLCFMNTVTTENSGTDMAYIDNFDAQLRKLCDSTPVASFTADSVFFEDRIKSFITIGLPPEQLPAGTTLLFSQKDASPVILQPGLIYQLSITYYFRSSLYLYRDNSVKSTITKLFALNDSQLDNLNKMNRNSTKHVKAIVIPLCPN